MIAHMLRDGMRRHSSDDCDLETAGCIEAERGQQIVALLLTDECRHICPVHTAPRGSTDAIDWAELHSRTVTRQCSCVEMLAAAPFASSLIASAFVSSCHAVVNRIAVGTALSIPSSDR